MSKRIDTILSVIDEGVAEAHKITAPKGSGKVDVFAAAFDAGDVSWDQHDMLVIDEAPEDPDAFMAWLLSD